MSKLTVEILNGAVRAGGAGALSSVTDLAPAGGEQSLVAPAKYTNGQRPTYVFEHRFVEGSPVATVLIDSRTSMANRVEDGLRMGIKEGNPILRSMPKIEIIYKDEAGNPIFVETDLDLPHRAFDGHIRLGKDIAGEDIVRNTQYIAARNATSDDASALFDVSPITLLLGGWDSTRKSHQARFAACLTGEIIGVLSDQCASPETLITRRSGARIDPVGSGFYFEQKVAKELSERSGKGDEPKANKGLVSGSAFVIGAIPPGTGNDAIDGISVSRIIRTRVLSFATLRSICFGKGAEADAAIRVLLAALGINGMVRSDSELLLRANAHLVEKTAPRTQVHERYGETLDIDPMTVAEADDLLTVAYEQANSVAGVSWNGQILKVVGDSAIIAAIDDSTDGE